MALKTISCSCKTIIAIYVFLIDIMYLILLFAFMYAQWVKLSIFIRISGWPNFRCISNLGLVPISCHFWNCNENWMKMNRWLDIFRPFRLKSQFKLLKKSDFVTFQLRCPLNWDKSFTLASIVGAKQSIFYLASVLSKGEKRYFRLNKRRPSRRLLLVMMFSLMLFIGRDGMHMYVCMPHPYLLAIQ